MPNYSLVINSKFQPFSFERYIQPYQLYGQMYKEQEAGLNELSTQAETLRQRAILEPNAEWSKKLLSYADSIEEQAGILASSGLSPNTRSALMNLRSQYGNTVVPVQSAIARQAELSKEAAKRSPSERMAYAAMPTIDELIADPTKTQIGYSGALVEQSAMQMAAAAASRSTDDKFEKYGTYWMRQLAATGYNRDTINQFLADVRTVPELANIIPSVSDQFGNFEGLSDSQKMQMASEIMSGILKGVTYKEAAQYQQDPVAMANLNYQFEIKKMDHEAEIRAKEKEDERKEKEAKEREEAIKAAFGPTVPMGVGTIEGNSVPLDRYKGIRSTIKDGKAYVQTDLGDKYEKEYNNAKAELDAFIKKHGGESKYSYYRNSNKGTTRGGYAGIGGEISKSFDPVPLDYYEYDKLKTKVEKAKKKHDAEQRFIESKVNQYSIYYPNDPLKAFTIGASLEQSQMAMQNYAYGLNQSNAGYENVLKGLNRTLGINTESAGLISMDDGKLISTKDKIEKLKDPSTALSVASTNRGVYLQVTDAKGKHYKVTGIKQIDDFNKTYTAINVALMNFSDKTTNNVAGASDEILNYVATYGPDEQFMARYGNNMKSIGNGLYGITLVSNSGDAMNVVIDNNSGKWYFSTLSDEVNNQGMLRATQIENAAKSALVELPIMIANQK